MHALFYCIQDICACLGIPKQECGVQIHGCAFLIQAFLLIILWHIQIDAVYLYNQGHISLALIVLLKSLAIRTGQHNYIHTMRCLFGWHNIQSYEKC